MATPDQKPQHSGAAGSAGGESPQPLWQRLRYPNEATFERLLERYAEECYIPETDGFRPYFQLAPWVRLEWPDKPTWEARKHLPCAKMAFPALRQLYPDRPDVPERLQDFAVMLRHYPDCFGLDFVTVHIQMNGGITINDLTYGPGAHRVPRPVGTELAHIDQASRKEFIDQFIPKVHQERVLATLNGVTGQVQEG